MFVQDDYLEWHDATAEVVIEELHRVEAVGNAQDIARMKTYVACDRRRVYRRDDCVDAAQWLSLEVGMSPWKARRWLRAGYALEELSVLRVAYERGELSTDKFVELARFAKPANEAGLLAWAKRTSPSGIRARADQELRADAEEVRDADRWRSLDWDWDETHTRLSLWGSLPADHGARFVAAVERMANKMPKTPEDFEGDSSLEARRADALVALASASIADDQSADRATVVVHTTVDGVLDNDKNGVLSGGLPIPPEAAAMLSCDSRVQTRAARRERRDLPRRVTLLCDAQVAPPPGRTPGRLWMHFSELRTPGLYRRSSHRSVAARDDRALESHIDLQHTPSSDSCAWLACADDPQRNNAMVPA